VEAFTADNGSDGRDFLCDELATAGGTFAEW
jgi:hypothetical protein